jgi:hypothetical protein
MTDEQLVQYLKKNAGHTCGRFRPEQLRSYSQEFNVNVNPGWMLLKAAFVSLLLVLVSKPSTAQSTDTKPKIENVKQTRKEKKKQSAVSPLHIVKGVVMDSFDRLPIPGVNVILKGTDQGTVTDAHGEFEFPNKLKEGDLLVFTFIGYVSEEFKVPRQIEAETVQMPLCMDVSVLGEVAVNETYTTKTGFREWWSKVKSIF